MGLVLLRIGFSEGRQKFSKISGALFGSSLELQIFQICVRKKLEYSMTD